MFCRALATALCDANELVKLKRNQGPPVPQTFSEFQQRYQLYSLHTKEPVDWRPIHETRFHNIIERYPEGCGIRLAEALRCLQASMQVISLFAQKTVQISLRSTLTLSFCIPPPYKGALRESGALRPPVLPQGVGWKTTTVTGSTL